LGVALDLGWKEWTRKEWCESSEDSTAGTSTMRMVCNEAVELTWDDRRFLEYVGYEDTADGLVLSDPDAAADNIESTYAGKVTNTHNHHIHR
jgi:hypothetical protein